MPRPSTARRKLKIKSQKSKELYSGLLRHFEWLVYLRARCTSRWINLGCDCHQNTKSLSRRSLSPKAEWERQ
ncbi:hypothetical protein [Nostoc sp.]|uniref:hypothetical protein n=1 Tax=Nostoc sp. TaxID=1180 RepID=UPI002FFACE2C